MARYGAAIDRDSAREMLARKLEAGAQQAEAERQAAEAQARANAEAKADAQAQREAERTARSQSTRQPSRRQDKGVLGEIVGSTTFRQVARSATTQIIRSIFGTARRRR
jgi:DNA double-strand break repair helicase HerA and related ATPase